jgi:hypothetical protein
VGKTVEEQIVVMVLMKLLGLNTNSNILFNPALFTESMSPRAVMMLVVFK